MSDQAPWQWPEERWRGIVDRVRAGRALRPKSWPGGARCAVALSFDSDHETNELREGGESIGRLSQGQYGNRQGVPRILQRPVGIRTPSWDFSPNTLAITKEMGLVYDSSLMADVDCYELEMNGEATGVVELPVEWIRDDAVYFNMVRFAGLRPYTPPQAVFDIFKREFDAAYREGGIFQLTMHPHISGYRSRIWILDELIRYMRSNAGVWFATHAEIAVYARAHAA